MYRISSNKRRIQVRKVNKRRPRISAAVPKRRLFEDLSRTKRTLQSDSETAWKGIVRSKLSKDTAGKTVKQCQKRRLGTSKRHFR